MPKLNELLLPKTIKNCASDKTPILTNDLVFVDSLSQLKNTPPYKLIVEPTDFASKNCILDSRSGVKIYTDQILNDYNYIDTDGKSFKISTVNNIHGVCPCIHVKLNDVIIENMSALFGVRLNVKGKPLYHTFKFGVYPQDKKDLETEFSLALASYFTKTGRNFTDTTKHNFPELTEYWHKGKKYVRFISMQNYVSWFEVKPIIWRVRNWSALPASINPHGTGAADFLDLKSEKALFGLCFHDDIIDESDIYSSLIGNKNPEKLSGNCRLWQNSFVRGFLNGIDVNYIKNANGNPAFNAPCVQNFEGKGFINTALGMELSDFVKQENPFYINGYLDLD